MKALQLRKNFREYHKSFTFDKIPLLKLERKEL